MNNFWIKSTREKAKNKTLNVTYSINKLLFKKSYGLIAWEDGMQEKGEKIIASLCYILKCFTQCKKSKQLMCYILRFQLFKNFPIWLVHRVGVNAATCCSHSKYGRKKKSKSSKHFHYFFNTEIQSVLIKIKILQVASSPTLFYCKKVSSILKQRAILFEKTKLSK